MLKIDTGPKLFTLHSSTTILVGLTPQTANHRRRYFWFDLCVTQIFVLVLLRSAKCFNNYSYSKCATTSITTVTTTATTTTTTTTLTITTTTTTTIVTTTTITTILILLLPLVLLYSTYTYTHTYTTTQLLLFHTYSCFCKWRTFNNVTL